MYELYNYDQWCFDDDKGNILSINHNHKRLMVTTNGSFVTVEDTPEGNTRVKSFDPDVAFEESCKLKGRGKDDPTGYKGIGDSIHYACYFSGLGQCIYMATYITEFLGFPGRGLKLIAYREKNTIGNKINDFIGDLLAEMQEKTAEILCKP